jgi:hypothetical protein
MIIMPKSEVWNICIVKSNGMSSYLSMDILHTMPRDFVVQTWDSFHSSRFERSSGGLVGPGST